MDNFSKYGIFKVLECGVGGGMLGASIPLSSFYSLWYLLLIPIGLIVFIHGINAKKNNIFKGVSND